MRHINDLNIKAYVNFISKKCGNFYGDYKVEVNDEVNHYKLKRNLPGDIVEETSTFVVVNPVEKTIKVAGNLLPYAKESGLPIENEVEEFDFVCTYIGTEMLNVAFEKWHTEFLEVMGMLEPLETSDAVETDKNSFLFSPSLNTPIA